MVSLGTDQTSGGFFFNRQESSPCPSLALRDEDLHHETSSLGLVTPVRFHPIPTTWIAVIQLSLIVTYEVLLFVFRDVMDLTVLGGVDPPFNFLVVLHVTLWSLMFLMDRILQYFHHEYQRKGFLEFFRQTKNIRRLPLYVLSVGNAVVLVIYAVLGKQPKWSGLQLVNVLEIIFTAEFICMFPVIVYYLVLVVKFNRSQPLPDAEDPGVVSSFTVTNHTATETGFRDSEYLDEVLEKQADMIRYLQQHNANLGKRLMKMMQQQTAA